MKIHPLGAELFHADRRTDIHDEADNRFSKFYEPAQQAKTLQALIRPEGKSHKLYAGEILPSLDALNIKG
jgi:hypothetical protein